MKYRILSLIFFTLLGFAYPKNAHTCIHPLLDKTNMTSKVSQSAQQALILHHNGVEDLFLKIDYEGENLKELGWVIPVRTVPDKYAVAENNLFQDLREWTNLERERPKARGVKGAKSASKSGGSSPIRLLPNTKVGPFEIQPIQAKGAGAVDALNQWMKEHQFATFTSEQLRYYIDRDWTFLAVRIVPEKTTPTLANSGSIPPLHLQFKSNEAIYPLKFSTHMGVFSTQITLITAEKRSESDFDGARCRGFEVVNDGYYYFNFINEDSNLLRAKGEFTLDEAPESLQVLLKERFSNIKQFHTSILLNEGVNKGESVFVKKLNQTCSDSPSQWSEDLAIPSFPEKKKQKEAVKDNLPTPKEQPNVAQNDDDVGCRTVSADGYFALLLLSFGILFRRRN